MGGALGALLRYWVSNAIYQALGRGFPFGTLVVNAVGSLFMGVLYVVLVERLVAPTELRAALIIGLLGAFTTFSTFSMETLSLLESGDLLKAVTNVALSVVLCVLLCWFGVVATRAV